MMAMKKTVVTALLDPTGIWALNDFKDGTIPIAWALGLRRTGTCANACDRRWLRERTRSPRAGPQEAPLFLLPAQKRPAHAGSGQTLLMEEFDRVAAALDAS